MALSPKTWLSTGLLVATLSLAVAGCGPVAPVSPSWKTDVRPLIVARCLRCHDGSGKGDPSVTDSTTGHAFNFNAPPDLPSPLPAGLLSLQMYGPKAVRGEGFKRRMPPPPLEALEDWQIDIFDGWAINPLP
jgi:hypothetical protein